MTNEQSLAHKLAFDAVLKRFANSIELVPSNHSFYGIEFPDEWAVFWVAEKMSTQLDGDEYVAVHLETGKVIHFS